MPFWYYRPFRVANVTMASRLQPLYPKIASLSPTRRWALWWAKMESCTLWKRQKSCWKAGVLCCWFFQTCCSFYGYSHTLSSLWKCRICFIRRFQQYSVQNRCPFFLFAVRVFSWRENKKLCKNNIVCKKTYTVLSHIFCYLSSSFLLWGYK